MPVSKNLSPNLAAFLDMIAWSEGTSRIGSADGYDVIVGGGTFDGYADHPRKLVKLSDKLSSTAAGRYQLLARFFDVYKKQLNLADFSPESQDKIAIQQIRECKALDAIATGRIDIAIRLCAHIWASLPGAGYGQKENKIVACMNKWRECRRNYG